jgi:hypothetical protein
LAKIWGVLGSFWGVLLTMAFQAEDTSVSVTWWSKILPLGKIKILLLFLSLNSIRDLVVEDTSARKNQNTFCFFSRLIVSL